MSINGAVMFGVVHDCVRSSVGSVFGTDGQVSTVFYAQLQSSLLALIGTVSSSTHSTSYIIDDWEGVKRETLIGEAGFWGARRVRNHFNYSEDFSNAAWYKGVTDNGVKSGVGPDGEDAHEFEFTGIGDEQLQQTASTIGIAQATPIRQQWLIRKVGGAGTQIRFKYGVTRPLVTIPESWQLITSGVNNQTGNDIGIVLNNGDTGITVQVIKAQVEDVTGQSNQNPGEYVSTDVLSDPWHGANVDGVKYFTTENGNTVDGSGVVTEATGAALTTLKGWTGDPGSTNKCTNYNANPDSGLTAVALHAGGDAACTFSRVTEASELASVGLQALCSSSYVIKVDNTSGVSWGGVNVAGATGNTNAHSLSAYAWCDTGTYYIGTNSNNTLSGALTNTAIALHRSENFTPANAGQTFSFRVNSGGVAYFILNQLEESAYAGLPVITEGTSVSTTSTDLTYDWPTGLVNDFVIELDWTPLADTQGEVWLFGNYTADNTLGILHDGTNIIARKELATVNNDATKALAYVEGTTYSIKARFSATAGVDVWVDNVKGTTDATTTDATVSTNFEVGSDGNSASNTLAGVGNIKIHQGNLTDAQVVAL